MGRDRRGFQGSSAPFASIAVKLLPFPMSDGFSSVLLRVFRGKDFALPITAMTCDLGDSGDSCALHGTPPPSLCIPQHPRSSGFIYLTHMLFCVILFLAVTGAFALFLLSATRAYATSAETGRVRWLRPNAALTTNPLLSKGDSWLQASLNQTSEFLDSPRQEARSLPKWNSPSHLITTSLKLSLPTKLHSLSILNPASKSPLNLSVGNLEVTNPSNAGDLFTASNYFSNIKTEPAERRVLSSHGVTGPLAHLVVFSRTFCKESDVGIITAGNPWIGIRKQYLVSRFLPKMSRY